VIDDEGAEAQATSALLALTGTKTVTGALGVIAAWKSSHENGGPRLAAVAIDKAIVKARARGALTVEIEAVVRGIAKNNPANAQAVLEALCPIK
jgi:hypothetical protein